MSDPKPISDSERKAQQTENDMSEQKAELKACPFCGHPFQDIGYHFGSCENPDCAVEAYGPKNELNKRAPDDRDREIERLRGAIADWKREVCHEGLRADGAEKQRDSIRAKLEASDKACAEMRDILRRLLIGWERNGPIPVQVVCGQIREMLSTDAGRNYIPRERLEEVKPLIQRLHDLADASDDFESRGLAKAWLDSNK